MSQQSNSNSGMFSTPSAGSTIEVKPRAKHKLRSISTNKQYNKAEQSPLKLDKIDFQKREKSFVLDCQKFSVMENLNYDPLLDNNLRLYFYNPRNKQNLMKNGLIKRDGSPVDQKMYRQFLNQTTIQRNNSIETFFEKEVVKKHKDNRLPPILKIDQCTPRNIDRDQEEFNTQQSTLRKTKKSPQERNNNLDNQFLNNFLTPQTKQKERKSPFDRSNSKGRIPRQNSTIDKDRNNKNIKIVHTYGYTIEALKEKSMTSRQKKKIQINQQDNNPNKPNDKNEEEAIKKEDFDLFMKTLREKYTRSKQKE